MKKILQLWLGIALVLGMMSTSVQAVGPNDEAEETEPAAAAAASPQASDSPPTLANLPQEVIDRIVPFLDPTSAVRLAEASRQMTRMVGDARIHHLKKALYQESGGPKDPTGKALPDMGLPVFHLERISDNLKQALSYYPPQQREGILKAALGSYELFAIKNNSEMAVSVASKIEGMQHENMYRLILQALGEDAQGLTSVQKAALQHQFLGYDVYYADEGKKNEWMQAFRDRVWKPCGRNGLQRFLDINYQAITAETEAIDTGHYWVIQHSQLAGLKDDINRLLPENAEGPHPTVVIDIDAAGPAFNIEYEDLPNRLRNLVLTNTNERITEIQNRFLNRSSLLSVDINLLAVKEVRGFFLHSCPHLKRVNLNLPAVENIGSDFMSYNSIEGLILNLPAVQRIGDSFLNACILWRLSLNLSVVQSVGNYFLAFCERLRELTLILPASQDIGQSYLSECTNLQGLILIMEPGALQGFRDVFFQFLRRSSWQIEIAPLD